MLINAAQAAHALRLLFCNGLREESTHTNEESCEITEGDILEEK